MKLIVLFSLISVSTASIFHHDTCEKIIMQDFRAYSCKNVDWWNNKKEHVVFTTKNYIINPFSPKRIWLNETQDVVGMSSSDAFVLLVNEGSANKEEVSMLLTRLLKGESTSTKVYVNPDEINEYKEDFVQADIDQIALESTFFILDYIKEHVFDHKPYAEIMEMYLDSKETVADWNMVEPDEWETINLPLIPFICDKKVVLVNLREDLSGSGVSNKDCNVDTIELINRFGYTDHEIISKIVERYTI